MGKNNRFLAPGKISTKFFKVESLIHQSGLRSTLSVKTAEDRPLSLSRNKLKLGCLKYLSQNIIITTKITISYITIVHLTIPTYRAQKSIIILCLSKTPRIKRFTERNLSRFKINKKQPIQYLCSSYRVNQKKKGWIVLTEKPSFAETEEEDFT